MTLKITPAQEKILEIVARFIAAKGYPPSRRQIASDLGCAVANVQGQLESLRAKGYVDWDDGVARSLRVIPDEQRQ